MCRVQNVERARCILNFARSRLKRRTKFRRKLQMSGNESILGVVDLIYRVDTEIYDLLRRYEVV